MEASIAMMHIVANAHCSFRLTGIIVETVTGPSTPNKDYYDDINANPAMPYQQLRALVGDGGKWKWPGESVFPVLAMYIISRVVSGVYVFAATQPKDAAPQDGSLARRQLLSWDWIRKCYGRYLE